MPVFRGRDFLERSLAPLRAARERGEIEQVLVVQDGDGEDIDDLCAAAGAHLLHTGKRAGPAAARNLGVDHAHSEVVMFVDADVVLHDDACRMVHDALSSDPNCVALFGSYDDDPPERGVVTTYANLRHHWTHQQSRGETHTFWAGCGAVRRADFLTVGGFDAARYPRPSIEDVELGLRLASRGRILLRADLQCTHLKRWGLANLISTDIQRRAVPWAQLICDQDSPRDELNLRGAERSKAALAWAWWASIAIAWIDARALWVTIILAAVAWFSNRELFGLTWGRRGPIHSSGAFLLHQLYYLYASAAFAVVAGAAVLRRPKRNKTPKPV